MTNHARITPAAVLWDLDGTLVDTEPLWLAAEHELAARSGKSWTEEDGLKLVGSDLMDAGRFLRDHLELDMTAEQVVDYMVANVAARLHAEPIVWRPGARELIEALDAEGIPQALVTMSYVDIAGPVAAQLPFGAVVTGDAVTHGKPHPEPYLTAAAQLGVEVSDCVAIEDSGTGANSANAAGCQVLVVPHMVNVPGAPRRTQRPTLTGLMPDDLRALFG